MWDVEYTDEFGEWWVGLTADEQDDVAVAVGLLESQGPHLRYPHSSGVQESRHGRMRELRIQHKGEPYRVLYAFDPQRTAILLLGGNKTGQNRWYKEFVPKADDLYDDHLETLKTEESREEF